jgi:hypothetical protein
MVNTPKTQALEMIKYFADRRTPGAFRRLSRFYIANELIMRVENPFLIDQGSAGLCGPASIVFNLARLRPVEYVRAVIDLFEKGVAHVDKWVIKPGDHLRHFDAPPGVPPADWIILASIRDSENWFYDYYRAKADEEIPKCAADGGTPMVEMENWLKKAGFQDIESDDFFLDLLGHKEAGLLKSLEYRADDYQVIWFLDAEMVKGNFGAPPKPDHWVVLTGPINPTPPLSNPATNITIPIFTWGERHTIPPKGVMTYATFLERWYGYIAAKL